MSGYQNVEEFVPDDPCGCIGGIPTITSLVPSAVDAASGAFTLTVNGTNFRPDSVVEWGGAARITTFISSIQLTAQILAGDVLTSGTASVRVSNALPGCGLSNASTFTINCVGGVPTITSLDPATAVIGGPDFTLTVNGTNYRPDSIVRWNGSDRATIYVSSIQLTATILAADIAAPGTDQVTVFNPPPGCGESAPFDFVVNATSGGAVLYSTTPTGASQDSTYRPMLEGSVKIPADNINGVFTVGGTLSNFYFEIQGFAANDYLDVGQSFTATVYVNGNPTALTVSASNPTPGTVFSDTNPAHAVAVNAGDSIRIEFTNSGSSVNSRAFSLLFVNNDGASIVCYGEGTTGVASHGIVIHAGDDYGFPITSGMWEGSDPTLNYNWWNQFPVPNAGTFKKLHVITNTSQPATGNLVIRLVTNPAATAPLDNIFTGDTALTLTIPAGSAAGDYSNVVDSVHVSQGDLVLWRGTNNAATDSAQITSIIAEFIMDDGGTMFAAPCFGGSDVGGDKSWTPPGQTDTYYTIGENQLPVSRDGTLKNFFIRTEQNTASVQCIVTVLVNGAATALTTTIPAGTAGTFSDTVHTAAVVKGDLITVEFDTTPTYSGNVGGTIGYTFELL